ncbi:hypothetical protein D6C85_02744 [Aureobasidium pullulans]|nr:hypothetical protein D6D26_03974 [Aureobasidium pullulans]THW57511.1 hypothetical protein D6D20_07920 [Aureobasidium pullulans]THZ00765.1 hypothetical protein D6C93_03622 [Aureobasidium pullulans]THZ75697.1 hypothetical protein D6C85_02744 [Aureobasidium pullulans]TIA23638.1 hypothetical protein D6C81_02897 [Aureobasidium pullulans]
MPDVEDNQELEQSKLSSLRDHFDAELTESWADSVLIVSSFITGLLDSAVFNVWSCFVSMQTGNTLYLGLGVSGQPKSSPWRWAKSGMSIISFVFGAFIFSRFMRWLGPLRRSTMVYSWLIQAVLIYICAALEDTGVVPNDAGDNLPNSFIVLLPLSLLSIQSAGQMAMSRILGYGEVTSVVLTSAYFDLVFDNEVFTAAPTRNVKRNRRIGSMVMVVLGAIAGGFLTQDEDISKVLWFAGSLKVAIAILWVFWKSKGSVRLE